MKNFKLKMKDEKIEGVCNKCGNDKVYTFGFNTFTLFYCTKCYNEEQVSREELHKFYELNKNKKEGD